MINIFRKFLSATVISIMTFALSSLYYVSSTNLNGKYIEDGIEYYITNTSSQKYAVVNGVDEFVVDLNIPESVQGIEVTEVNLFSENNLETVFIPKTISDISISDSLNIKAYYVDENNENYFSQDGVIYDDDVKTLLFYPAQKEDRVFTVPNSVKVIGEKETSSHAFECCEYLEEINFNEGLTEIGDMVFYNCKFEKLRFPDSLTTIGNCAFSENRNLKDVLIHKNLKEMPYIFYGCKNLETVTFLDDNLDFSLESSYAQPAIMQYASIFDGCYGSITAYVPDKKVEKYKELAELWALKSVNVQPLSNKLGGIIGDADYNDKIGVPDAVTLMKFLMGKDVTISANADINHDGKVNVFDMILMRRMLEKVY